MSKTGGKPGFQSMPGTQIMWFSLILDGRSQRARCALGPREDMQGKESELSEKWAWDSQDTMRIVRTLQCVRALNPWMPSWLQIEMLFSQNVLHFVLLSYPTACWAGLKLESSAISPQLLSPVPPFLLLLSLSLPSKTLATITKLLIFFPYTWITSCVQDIFCFRAQSVAALL